MSLQCGHDFWITSSCQGCLIDRIRRLRAVVQHAQHRHPCAISKGEPCSCGYGPALAALKPGDLE